MVLWLTVSIDLPGCLAEPHKETTAYVINDAGAKACLEVHLASPGELETATICTGDM